MLESRYRGDTMTQENKDKLLVNGSDGGMILMQQADALVQGEASVRAARMLEGFSRCIPAAFSRAQKVQLLMEVFAKQIQYADDWNSNPARYTWYSALVAKKAVCEGISELFFRFCQSQGIPCRIIHGVGGEGQDEGLHSWNLVRLENGNWYHCDLTWSLGQRREPYKYLLKSDAFMKANGHDWLPGLFPTAPGSCPDPTPFQPAGIRLACEIWDRSVQNALKKR